VYLLLTLTLLMGVFITYTDVIDGRSYYLH